MKKANNNRILPIIDSLFTPIDEKNERKKGCINKYIYRRTHVPKEGWLQGCFKCWAITGNSYIYLKAKNNNPNHNYIVYLCYECYPRILKNTLEKKKYELRIDNYINRYYTPVEPKPPDPLSVNPKSSSFSTNSTKKEVRFGPQI
jgi:hypothetical protein